MSQHCEIDVLTYGGRPEGKDGFRMSADSTRAARAAAELAISRLSGGQQVHIHIPGATFYKGLAGKNREGVMDAQRMASSIRAELKRQHISPDRLLLTYNGDNINTATQLAEIAERDKQIASQVERVIICSDWQREDVQGLMRNRLKGATVVTDLEVYKNRFGSNGKHLSDRIKGSPIDKLKREGLQAKIFSRLNSIDRTGLLRTLASKALQKLGKGLGVADIDYRGLESGAIRLAKTTRKTSGPTHF